MKFVSHGNYAYDRLAYTKHSKYKKSLLYLSRSSTAAPPKYLYTHEPLVQALSSQNSFWASKPSKPPYSGDGWEGVRHITMTNEFIY